MRKFGCVRLTLFRKKTPYIDDKKSLIRGFLELLEYKMALKLSLVSESLQKCLPKFTEKDKSNSYSAYPYSGIRSIERNLSLTRHCFE